MVNSMTRQIGEIPGMGWLRHQIALTHALRDYEGAVMMSKKMGFALFSDGDLGHSLDRGSTLFILGSGESVEEMTSDHWGVVREAASIGINSWAVHDFVPDAYSFEEVESESYSDVSSSLSQLLARDEVLASRPRILMLRPHASTSPTRIVRVPAPLRSEVRIYGRTTLFTREVRNLSGDLERILRSMMTMRIPPAISLDAGMSVSRLITLGARGGFTRIVLVGIDLNSPRYFFDINPSYWERRGALPFNPWRNRGPVHDTEETLTRSFRATEFIPVLSAAVRLVFGTRVFVSSSSSALASSLPVFRWDAKRELV